MRGVSIKYDTPPFLYSRYFLSMGKKLKDNDEAEITIMILMMLFVSILFINYNSFTKGLAQISRSNDDIYT
jgi:hypothetical protein